MLIPNLNFGQAPNLGVTSSFALFTAVGAFDNTEATLVTGNIGSNTYTPTGFPIPGTVVGNIYKAGDAVSSQAATDVATAYSDLSTLTPDRIIGVTLGSGQILTSGVNSTGTGSAASLAGNLTLNAEGDSNALFIFQIDGAFSTSTNSNIILMNSASLNNVYWQINGAFSLGAGSVFYGTVIVNGAINLLEASSLTGRGLSKAGAIYLHNNVVAIKTQPFIVLPVELVLFKVEKCDTKSCVNLNWQTASETNSNYFLIEKSKDGINFKTIGTREAAGNSTQLLSYFFTDENPDQNCNYYRLNQFDFNGIHEYSPVKSVCFSKTILTVNIFPNPFTTSINIFSNNEFQNNNYELRIYNFSGKDVINITITKQLTTLETSHLPSGMYFYKVIDNDKIIQSGSLISQQ